MTRVFMITAANNDQGVTYIQVRKERVVVMIAEMIEEQLHTLDRKSVV